MFYDIFDKNSIEHQLKVAKRLISFAKDDLCFNDKIQFYIAFTPILNLKEVAEKFSDCQNSLFLIMKKKQIYSFGESQVINCLTDNLVLLTRAQHNIVHMSEEQLEKIGNLDEYLMEEYLMEE